MKLIAHLDADCFYVSAERIRTPFLNAKPVGVLGNQGACVIAKSYEMKAYGVKTGEPIWDAVDKCPNGIFVQRDFAWYEVISRQMLEIVRSRSPQVEYYSIDEFFMSVDSNDPIEFAENIRETILKQVCVPVTIGIARTRTLAKLISDNAKPFGAKVLLPSEEITLLESLPVTDITGIAGRSARKLATVGIKTCLDFIKADRRLIRRLLTVTGERLWYELQGERSVPIQSKRSPHKIVSRGGSIGKCTTDPMRQWAWAMHNLERLIEALELYDLDAGTLALSLTYKSGESNHAKANLTSPTRRSDMFLEAAQFLWDKVAIPGGLLYRMHYFASNLQYPGIRQLGLFDPPLETETAIRSAKQKASKLIGRWSIRSGATVMLEDLYRGISHKYEICDVAGKTCF